MGSRAPVPTHFWGVYQHIYGPGSAHGGAVSLLDAGLPAVAESVEVQGLEPVGEGQLLRTQGFRIRRFLILQPAGGIVDEYLSPVQPCRQRQHIASQAFAAQQPLRLRFIPKVVEMMDRQGVDEAGIELRMP